MNFKKILSCFLSGTCLLSVNFLKVSAENDINDNLNAYTEINNNIPYFTEIEKDNTTPFEVYEELDEYGRCGVAYANVCKEIMPTGEREDISSIEPTGWHSIQYECIPGGYLYNRCHLIGYQLSGENANEKNIITGTRNLNINGMLPFENAVDDYVEETDNHVLYRVTPCFEDDNLIASGVTMEAYSVEDDGEGICYNVYCYNEQENITIDYGSGNSFLIAASSVKGDANSDGKLNVRDAATIASYLSQGKGSSLPLNSDYNGDGTVNVRDAAAIAKKLAGSSGSSSSGGTSSGSSSSGGTSSGSSSSGGTSSGGSSSSGSSQPNSSVVYITKTGKKYHCNSNCGNGTYYEATLSEALAKGLTQCSKCY